jgi:hypothetical protein
MKFAPLILSIGGFAVVGTILAAALPGAPGVPVAEAPVLPAKPIRMAATTIAPLIPAPAIPARPQPNPAPAPAHAPPPAARIAAVSGTVAGGIALDDPIRRRPAPARTIVVVAPRVKAVAAHRHVAAQHRVVHRPVVVAHHPPPGRIVPPPWDVAASGYPAYGPGPGGPYPPMPPHIAMGGPYGYYGPR